MPQNTRLIARVDANGIITYLNNEYLEWLGYSADEIIGQNVRLLRADNIPEIIQQTIQKECQANRPVNFPVIEKKKSGESYWADMRIQPVCLDGQYQGYTSVKRIISVPDKQTLSEQLYHSIAQNKLEFYHGEWVPTTKHKLNRLIGWHTASLSRKVMMLSLGLIASIVFISFLLLQNEKLDIKQQVAANHSQNLASSIESLMVKKSDLGITNAIGITNASDLLDAAKNTDKTAMSLAIGKLSERYRNNSNFRSVKLHFTDENQQSFYKSWKPLNKQKISDLSNRGYLHKVAKEQKPMVVNAVSSAGFNIKTILPIVIDGRYEGAVEFIQGSASLRRDIKKQSNRLYLLTVSTDYIMKGDKFRKMNADNIPVSNDKKWVVGNDKHFSMENSGVHIEALRQIDLTTLFQQGYLTTSEHFHFSKPIYDSSENLIGYHIISEEIEAYQAMLNAQLDVAQGAFYELVSSLIIFMILVQTLIWLIIIRPIKLAQNTMEEAVNHSDLFARVHTYGNDEIAQMTRAYNRQSMLSQVAISEISSAMEEILAGRLNYEITYPFQSDYGILKARINETSRSLNTTFTTIEEVMNDLQNGDFSKQHTNTLKGAYAQVVNDCLTAMASLSSAFKEINYVMEFAARGKFDERIHNNAQGDILALQATLNQTLEHIQTGFSDVVDAASRIAQGDLTQPITHDYEFTMDAAKQAVNQSMSGLTNTLSQVTQISHQVQADTRSVAEGTHNLNQRTQEQAAALEKTSQAMEETNSQIHSNLDNTKEASAIAQSQSHMLQTANQLMGETKHSMSDIQTASDKIREITGLIDSIAFQTNLLALNAAVEAARAGEHGRGFAVVAGEVRNLAGKSADAAKDISRLIGETSDAINIGVEQVERVGSSLDQVTTETKKMLSIVEEVSIASQEQSQGVNEINQSITHIDNTTQQNAALVEETTATTETLLESAEQLQASVNAFQLQQKLN